MVAMPKMVPYAAGLAAVLALGACSGGNPATAETVAPPSVTSPSSAPSATGSPPSTSTTTEAEDPVLAKIPKEARAETKESAAAFAAYYIQQLDAASRQGDPALLAGLALDTCKMCDNFSESVSALKRKGQHHRGTTIEVRKSDPLRFSGKERTVLLDVQLFSVPIVDGSEAVVGKTEADAGSFVATLKFDKRWFIERLQVVAP